MGNDDGSRGAFENKIFSVHMRAPKLNNNAKRKGEDSVRRK